MFIHLKQKGQMMQLVPISKEQIDNVFKNAKEPSDYIVELYKIIFPEYETQKIKITKGYPKVSHATDKYIWDKVMKWDKKHHIIPEGFYWMDYGFTDIGEDIPDWMANLSGVIYEYK